VIDIGAGPGYATVDLAEIVGPTGEVLAVERSEAFTEFAKSACSLRGLSNVRIERLDLAIQPLPPVGFDASWCRWVAAFVTSPSRLVASIAGALRLGGVATFHEYYDYRGWRMAPRRPHFERFVDEVIAAWRDEGGEPDIALELPGLLQSAGFRIESATPHVFATTPTDFVWQWPAAFMGNGLLRLVELGRIDRSWANAVLEEFREAEADVRTLMVTPGVLEIIARREV
jgi:SAM-dependent methyltransferase